MGFRTSAPRTCARGRDRRARERELTSDSGGAESKALKEGRVASVQAPLSCGRRGVREHRRETWRRKAFATWQEAEGRGSEPVLLQCRRCHLIQLAG